MRLAMLTGSHYTEQDRLTDTLLRNKDDFAKRGISMPNPNTYRGLIRDILNAMHRSPVADDAGDVLLDAILAAEEPETVILSDPNFFRTAGTAVQNGVFYPAAPQRMAYMAQLFPDDELEMFFNIRNPAAMLPTFFENAQQKEADAFWGGRQPQDMRWSETISQIRAAAPGIAITVYCNEDMPLIWSQVVREVAGLPAEEKIGGGFDLLHTIMSKEGMQRFRAYLDNHPGMTESQKRRVIMVFLEKFAIEDEIEEELDMLGWTEELVEELSVLYDEDLHVIQQIPGVEVILP